MYSPAHCRNGNHRHSDVLGEEDRLKAGWMNEEEGQLDDPVEDEVEERIRSKSGACIQVAVHPNSAIVRSSVGMTHFGRFA